MWNFIRSILGEVTVNELTLVALLFAAILLFSWAPKLGEAVGGVFDDDEPPD